MIGCDTCNEWYHGDCVDITKAQAEHIDNWNCLKCEVNQLTTENRRLTFKYVQLLDVVCGQEKEKRDLLLELYEIRQRQSKDMEYDLARLKMEKQLTLSYNNKDLCFGRNNNNNVVSMSPYTLIQCHDGPDSVQLNVDACDGVQQHHSRDVTNSAMDCAAENSVPTKKENHPTPSQGFKQSKVSRLSLKYKKTVS
ncbi:CXXC-type zinc finger protein 1 [Frankliniella fusca]|uniref:CXXC-type zinc finger protein 1 n=1 Tax=Frankliniella fusca TaxID=407009 RepID=A0AAE1LPA7_9NEOP|nr:CXXC-type zinc finger protein 1 [Frankliniella fusca]